MALDQRQRELVAIGASIGALCRPCVDHHIPAARAAGLSDAEVRRAVQTARTVHRAAQQRLFVHAAELLDPDLAADDPPDGV